jgi:hypothetical protein
MAKAKTEAAPAVEPRDPKIVLRMKVEKLLTLRERAKKAYAAAGSLLNELVREMKPGDRIELSDGRVATMKDAFANQNWAYRNTSFTRCDLEISG